MGLDSKDSNANRQDTDIAELEVSLSEDNVSWEFLSDFKKSESCGSFSIVSDQESLKSITKETDTQGLRQLISFTQFRPDTTNFKAMYFYDREQLTEGVMPMKSSGSEVSVDELEHEEPAPAGDQAGSSADVSSESKLEACKDWLESFVEVEVPVPDAPPPAHFSDCSLKLGTSDSSEVEVLTSEGDAASCGADAEAEADLKAFVPEDVMQHSESCILNNSYYNITATDTLDAECASPSLASSAVHVTQADALPDADSPPEEPLQAAPTVAAPETEAAAEPPRPKSVHLLWSDSGASKVLAGKLQRSQSAPRIAGDPQGLPEGLCLTPVTYKPEAGAGEGGPSMEGTLAEIVKLSSSLSSAVCSRVCRQTSSSVSWVRESVLGTEKGRTRLSLGVAYGLLGVSMLVSLRLSAALRAKEREARALLAEVMRLQEDHYHRRIRAPIIRANFLFV